MDALLIVTATVVAVLIVFRTIAPSGKPSFTVACRVPTRGLASSVSALGKACEKTERGKGVSAARVCRGLKKLFMRISHRSEREKWECAFAENADMLIQAADKSRRALRRSYMLGHVRGMPRIFLLCKDIAEKTRGYADIELFTELVKRFSAEAPLSVAECRMLGEMFVFCLCGVVSSASVGAERRDGEYRKGRADGADGRADLDRIASDDYICGLAETAADPDAVARMAENNGIDLDAAAERRRRSLAETYALVTGAANAAKVFYEQPSCGFLHLSEAYAVLTGTPEFSAASEKERARLLYSIASTAKRRGLSEVAFAEECADYAVVSGGSMERYVSHKPRFLSAVRYVLPMIAAAAITALLCAFSAPIFAAFYALSFAVVAAALYRIARVLSMPHYSPRSIGGGARSVLRAVTGATYLRRRLDMLRTVGRRLDSTAKDRKLAVLYAKLLTECMTAVACAAAQLFGIVFVARWFSWTAFAVSSSACIALALAGLFACGAELSLKPLKCVLTAVLSFAAIPSAAVFCVAECLFGRKAQKREMFGSVRRMFAVSAVAQLAAAVAVIAVGAVFCPPMTAVGCVFAVFPLLPFAVVKINSALSEKPKSLSQPEERAQTDADGMLFGGEQHIKLCLISGGGAYIACDSRGGVAISDCVGGVPRARYRFGAVCAVGASAFDLAHCGGVFQKHKAVYRAFSAGAEFAAEIVASTEISACACMITIVNRTAAPVDAELTVFLSPEKSADRAAGLSVGGDTDVGDTCGPIAVKHKISIGAFSKKRIAASVVFAADGRGAEQMFSVAQSDGFYEYAECCARGYDGLDVAPTARMLVGDRECDGGLCDPSLPTLVYDVSDRRAQKELDELKKYGYGYNAFYIDERAEYGASHKNGVRVLYGSRDGAAIAAARRVAANAGRNAAIDECACEPSFGLESNTLKIKPSIVRPHAKKRGLDISRNILTDGTLYAAFDGYGAADGSCAACGKKVELPRAFVAVEAEGAVWSPTVRPCGKGAMTARHFCGRSEFDCIYHGMAVCAKVYAARGACGVVYDVEIEDRLGEERQVYIMFAAEAPRSLLPVRHSDLRGGAAAFSETDGNGFAIFASESVAERAYYAQAYRSFGGIRRAHGFSDGGDNAALALSVAARIEPNGKKRVVFLLAAKAGELYARGIDEAAADGYYEDCIAFWSRLGAVRLNSSDDAFNAAYKTSLYSAYTNAARYGIKGDAVGALASGSAVKYADPNAVIERISAACGQQAEDGSFSGVDIKARHGVLKTLFLPLVAADIAEFVGDASLYETEVRFESGVRASVREHCLRAIDAAADNVCAADGIDAAALYAALGAYSFFCDDDRKRRYRELMKSMWFVGSYRLGDGETLRKMLGDGALFDTVYALSLYVAGDASAAYAALGRAMSSTRERLADDYAASTLFYIAVTENLLGIKVRGSKADIDPHTADITPHIEFSYDCGGAVTRIAVDDSVERGEWQMSVGRITYAHAKLDLDKGSDGVIVFRRNDRIH